MSIFSLAAQKVNYFCFVRAYTTCFIDSCCGVFWSECSKRHDKRYVNKRLNRKQADILLYRCYRRKTRRMWNNYASYAFSITLYVIVRGVGWTRYGTKANK